MADNSPEKPDRPRVHHRRVGAPDKTVRLARKLRKEMSLPEVLLWCELKGKPMGMKFRKQMPVGDYVADFACVEVRLLIEVDGIAHDMGDRPERDEVRTQQLEAKGWKVVRIPAKEVLRDVKQVAQSLVIHAVDIKSSADAGVDLEALEQETNPCAYPA